MKTTLEAIKICCFKKAGDMWDKACINLCPNPSVIWWNLSSCEIEENALEPDFKSRYYWDPEYSMTFFLEKKDRRNVFNEYGQENVAEILNVFFVIVDSNFGKQSTVNMQQSCKNGEKVSRYN